MAEFILMLGRLYQFVLLARVLMSWVQINPYHPVVQVLLQLTEPVLQPIRQVLPQTMGLDFSPVIAMILVQLVTQVIVAAL
ncbi:MAG: YggT family protein [Anaerolineae bacterium]|nr:YggT family protein [Anaerolineae bacterium]